MEKKRVAIVKVTEQRLDEAIVEMISLLGGMEEIVPGGSRVLIKPNFTFAPTHRGITNPEVIEGVVRMVADTAPREVVIAEGSGDAYTSQAFRFQGMYRIAARYGARVVDLNLEEGVKTTVPEGLGREYIMVPKAVVESDIFISIPIFKLWGDNPLSLSLKNLIGLYGGRYYGYNKNSDSLAREYSFYGLPGDVGVELGSHKPTVPESVCAMNSVVKTDLAIIDALEGGDGVGNFLRLDTLVAGRNPVATDTVGLAIAGFSADEYPTFKLCAEHGLGPCRLEEIEVVGEKIEDVSFPLERLSENVLELPAWFCLNLLSTDELHQIHRAFKLYGFLPKEAEVPETRQKLLDLFGDMLEAKGFYDKALKQCDEHTLNLLELLIAQGGTAGDIETIRDTFSRRCGGGESLYYAPAARTLTRLGLAYTVAGTCRNYYILPEGVVEALKRIRIRFASREKSCTYRIG